jgi:tetratricopeptide (TPR) repeat protein
VRARASAPPEGRIAFFARDGIFLFAFGNNHQYHTGAIMMKIDSRAVLLLLCAWALLARASARAQDTVKAAPPTEASAIEQAQALLGAGKIDAAIGVLSSIQKPSPNEQQISLLLGLAYYQKNDYARAVAHFSAGISRPLEGSRLYQQGIQLLGLSHYFLGHIKEAIPYLEQVKSWAPDNAEMAYVLGVSYIQSHQPDKSREAFARMFGLAPRSAAAYLMNAQMMIRQQFEETAEKELEKALELDPKLPQINFLLGEMAIYRAELDRGIELLRKEIAVNPAFAMAYYRLGEAYTRQLKWDEAVAPLQKSIWLSPFFSGPYIVLGKVYLKKNDLANAESILRRAVKMDPNNFSAHHLLAQVLQQSNRLEEAKKEFELADRLRTGSER